ncbi:MAG: hypothetical protein Q9219_000353 [cf. Caloplaca sp. 3 TL-2023]
MADPPAPSTAAVSAAFPAPPPFYKSFTADNLARLSALQETNPSLSADDLPLELQNLLPPRPPAPNQQYRSFGETRESVTVPSTEPPAKDPPNPHRLLQTTRQLLLAFLSLTSSLATKPDTWAPKWDEMRALFSEAHGIVNEYRPHQARETLIHMMEEQVERCKMETKTCKDACERVRGVLEKVERGDGKTQPNIYTMLATERTKPTTDQDSIMAVEKRVWDVIEQEVGSFG